MRRPGRDRESSTAAPATIAAGPRDSVLLAWRLPSGQPMRPASRQVCDVVGDGDTALMALSRGSVVLDSDAVRPDSRSRLTRFRSARRPAAFW